MKISIPLSRDSENSHPAASELELESYNGETVKISISDSPRYVTVPANQLQAALTALIYQNAPTPLCP